MARRAAQSARLDFVEKSGRQWGPPALYVSWPRRRAQPGIMTLLMTWMTPFDWMTFGMVMRASPLASVTVRWPAAALEGERLALNRIEHSFAAALVDLAVDVLGGKTAGDDMIGQDRGQHGLVLGLQQRLDRALGQRGERLVGRREHGEGSGAFERLDQAGGLHRRDSVV